MAEGRSSDTLFHAFSVGGEVENLISEGRCSDAFSRELSADGENAGESLRKGEGNRSDTLPRAFSEK